MFNLGASYLTNDGAVVKIMEVKDEGGPYHAVKGDDELWRYGRNQDTGRVTASRFNMSDPKNLKPYIRVYNDGEPCTSIHCSSNVGCEVCGRMAMEGLGYAHQIIHH